MWVWHHRTPSPLRGRPNPLTFRSGPPLPRSPPWERGRRWVFAHASCVVYACFSGLGHRPPPPWWGVAPGSHVQLSSFVSINHSSASSIQGTLLPQTSKAMLSGVDGLGALTILGKSGNHFLFERDRLVCSCQSRDVREIIRALRRSHGSVQLPRPRADGARSRCFWAQLRAWQRVRERASPTTSA